MEEREWAIAACKGNEEAFYQLVSAHRRKLYGIAYGYMHNEQDALDMLQETVYRGLLQCRKLRNPERFIPWLIRIMINCCMDELKRQRRSVPLMEHHMQGQIVEMHPEHRLDLERALQRLKPNHRHVLILKYYNDLTLTEIASIMERPEGTIKTWLNQGLKQIRQKLDKGGIIQHEHT
ncbi:sigma-70 family RNA polymerase sigma factor [Paenibacillus sp. WLX2291]|uniref:sigma-70 family RNA polymerase sigma factor n=1 Tax=Paenibacillus sp. WLX2291 TaxID=3296934 RepID=UPI003983EC2D